MDASPRGGRLLRPEDRVPRDRRARAAPGSAARSRSTSPCRSASASSTPAADGQRHTPGDDPPGDRGLHGADDRRPGRAPRRQASRSGSPRSRPGCSPSPTPRTPTPRRSAPRSPRPGLRAEVGRLERQGRREDPAAPPWSGSPTCWSWGAARRRRAGLRSASVPARIWAPWTSPPSSTSPAPEDPGPCVGAGPGTGRRPRPGRRARPARCARRVPHGRARARTPQSGGSGHPSSLRSHAARGTRVPGSTTASPSAR